jgi:hypothetical protein
MGTEKRNCRLDDSRTSKNAIAEMTWSVAMDFGYARIFSLQPTCSWQAPHRAATPVTVVMTSHDLARAEDLATRFDILSRGVIVASAKQDEMGSGNLLSFYKEALAA